MKLFLNARRQRVGGNLAKCQRGGFLAEQGVYQEPRKATFGLRSSAKYDSSLAEQDAKTLTLCSFVRYA